MMHYKTWKLEIEFKDGQKVSRFVKSDRLRLGKSPKCEYHHGQFTKDVELELESLPKGEVKNLEFDFATFCISDLTIEFWNKYNNQWAEKEGHESDISLQSPILWHFRNEMLISTSLLTDYENTLPLSTGPTLTWKKDDPYTLLFQKGDDLRSLELLRNEKGHLVAETEEDRFLVTQAEDFKTLNNLEHPEYLENEPKSKFNRALLGALMTWIVFVFVANFASQFLPKEVVEETLPSEMAKVTLEKAPQGKVDKGGGNGQAGGGGVESVAESDPRGGSGQVEETVVSDRAIFGGAKIMSALSALDEGMNNGKVVTAGVAAISKGSANGILGALASLTGKGGGKNGLGLGGLGTKGFGGGGGGGNGTGFGTGVGAGLGKGEGLRNISFDNDSASVRGGLEKSEVDAVVKENFSQVRYCYNKALRNNPQLQGKLISNFVISGDGSVKTSRIKESSLGMPEVENCVKQRVATWKFPQPRGGSTVEVSYPFLLKAF